MPLSSSPTRCSTTTTESSEDKEGRDTSRPGPRRASRAFNSELVDIQLDLCPIDQFSQSTWPERIAATAKNVQNTKHGGSAGEVHVRQYLDDLAFVGEFPQTRGAVKIKISSPP